MPKSARSCWYADASSSGFRFDRWRFSSRASRSMSSSAVSLMTAGIVSRPSSLVARRRRSPMISSYLSGCPAIGRTTIGCSTPTSRMLATSSSSASRSNSVRGCAAFGTMSAGERFASRAPGTATSSTVAVVVEPMLPWFGKKTSTGRAEESEIGMSAPIPRPSPVRFAAISGVLLFVRSRRPLRGTRAIQTSWCRS